MMGIPLSLVPALLIYAGFTFAAETCDSYFPLPRDFWIRGALGFFAPFLLTAETEDPELVQVHRYESYIFDSYRFIPRNLNLCTFPVAVFGNSGRNSTQ